MNFPTDRSPLCTIDLSPPLPTTRYDLNKLQTAAPPPLRDPVTFVFAYSLDMEVDLVLCRVACAPFSLFPELSLLRLLGIRNFIVTFVHPSSTVSRVLVRSGLYRPPRFSSSRSLVTECGRTHPDSSVFSFSLSSLPLDMIQPSRRFRDVSCWAVSAALSRDRSYFPLVSSPRRLR